MRPDLVSNAPDVRLPLLRQLDLDADFVDLVHRRRGEQEIDPGALLLLGDAAFDGRQVGRGSPKADRDSLARLRIDQQRDAAKARLLCGERREHILEGTNQIVDRASLELKCRDAREHSCAPLYPTAYTYSRSAALRLYVCLFRRRLAGVLFARHTLQYIHK